ncbi:MAG: hypothetical protein KAJ58_01710 [Candidatus Pacebacteria bacterium]|nr:hypothetical protein [Candidatus Paceibacterota bacterium]
MQLFKDYTEATEWNGYKLMQGHLLKLVSDIGFFPALLEDEPFVCLNRDLIETVWGLLPRRCSEIIDMHIYANYRERKCYNVGFGKISSIRILTRYEADLLSEELFWWSQKTVFLTDNIIV